MPIITSAGCSTTWKRPVSARTRIVVLVSDNGASGEGGPNGSVNENLLFNGIPDDMKTNLAMVDEFGGTKTYNHYANGWAMAFNTPFKMWKRYEFNGGTSDACMISWPAGMKARGELRTQYHHAIDIVPTILDCLGLEAPRTIKGHVQSRMDGVSMRYSFDDAPAADPLAGPSSSRCSAREGSGTTAGRPSRTIRRSRAGGISTPTSGSCTTRTSTGPSFTTSLPRSRRSSARWSTCGSPRRARTTPSLWTTGRRWRS